MLGTCDDTYPYDEPTPKAGELHSSPGFVENLSSSLVDHVYLQELTLGIVI